MDNRKLVEVEVKNNPGISFRELKDRTGLAQGTIQYHVRESEKIQVEKGALLHRETCRKCGLRQKCTGKCLRKVLRDEVTSEVKKGLEKGMKNREIAENLGIDPSTVSYHKNKLEEHGLLKLPNQN